MPKASSNPPIPTDWYGIFGLFHTVWGERASCAPPMTRAQRQDWDRFRQSLELQARRQGYRVEAEVSKVDPIGRRLA